MGLSGASEEAPYTLYDFRHTREKEGPLEFIGKDYQGYVQADAYGGHDELMKRDGIVEVGCWDHGRRYFTEASEEDPVSAAEALAYIKVLYRIEKEVKDAAYAEREACREEKSMPVLETFKDWLDDHAESFLPKSGMNAAIRYCRNQWTALNAYTGNGRLPISNCLCEQSFKAIATGRKNWLFLGSEEGGKAAAIVFSMTMTCRRLGLDARAYLKDVLQRVYSLPCSRLEELLPDAWKQEREAAGQSVSHRDSPLDHRERKALVLNS